MSTALTIFLITVVLIFVRGIPAIRRTVFLPLEFEFKVVKREELEPHQQQFFTDIERQLHALGYELEKIFRVTNLPNANITYAFSSISDSGRCYATCITALNAQATTIQNYIEFVNEFTDGTVLTTRNSSASDVLAHLPGHTVKSCPGVTDISALRHKHTEQMTSFRAVPASRQDNLLDLLNEKQRKFCDHQVKCGLLEWKDADRLFYATTRCALRGIANFLNPFADNFTPLRGLSAVLAGIGFPLLGMIAVSPYLGPPYPEALAIAVHLALYGAAGAYLGHLFSGKTFIWSFLLGMVPLMALDHSLPYMYVYPCLMACTANWVCNIKAKFMKQA